MFTQYIDRFLNLLERFVVASERRNELLAKQSGTTIAQDVASAEKHIAATESASNGSASDAATTTRGRGRGRAAVAGTENAEDSQAEAQQEEAASTGGRRQRVRANATEQQEAGTEGSAGATTGGRRERKRATETKKEPEPIKDTPEQADDRAEIENLCQLSGDVDDAAAEVKEYFKSKGWNVATDIPSADLEDALADLNEIADKYFD